jgi:alkanesulfonate monooxygenase SsuD/methylene tetrahydromethanopterin reductase-like flavin-dependent oxidoreductase (luciferase family)
MADLGLTDYAIDRWALAGTPRDWIARIEQLAERGARKLWMGVSGGNLDEQGHYLRLMGEEIMPKFAG